MYFLFEKLKMIPHHTGLYREVLILTDKINSETTLAQRLKKYRALCGLTQQQVSDILNINRTTYTKYETGVSEPSQEVLKKIVSIFGIDYNALLGVEDVLGADFFDNSLPMFRLTNSENDLVFAYRAMSKEDQQELMKIAKQMLSVDKSNKE